MVGLIKTIDEAINNLNTTIKDINANNFDDAINSLNRIKTFLVDIEKINRNIFHGNDIGKINFTINSVMTLITNLDKRKKPEQNKPQLQKDLNNIIDQVRGIRVVLNRPKN